MSENNNSGLIYIPDISGFTKFINETEVTHSNHIISELLEIMIDSNELKFELSEIEVDAILFYRFGSKPSLKEIIEQTRATFLKFHTHLKRYENERICNCGACASASALTLKFVVHAGNISTITVKDHKKLTGRPVIVSHRLLKNNIKGNEYLLLSKDYLKDLDTAGTEDINWIDWEQGSSDYDEVGSVEYEHFSLAPLHDQVAEPEPPPAPRLTNNPVVASIEINSSVKDIHAVSANFVNKEILSAGKIKIEWEEKGIPKIGTSHRCIQVGGAVFNFVSSGSSFDDSKAEYTEDLKEARFPFKNIVLRNLFEKQASGRVLVTSEFHYDKFPVIGQIVELFVRPKLKNIAMEGLEGLKEFCEDNFPIEASASQASA